jgi:hypothetical protein
MTPLAGAWYPEYGYEAPECIGLCGRPAEAGQRLYDEMFGEWQPACAECVTYIAGVPTPRELQRASLAGLLAPHERLSEISPARARELGRQLTALDEARAECETCGAVTGMPCQTASGEISKITHKARIERVPVTGRTMAYVMTIVGI